MDYLPFAIGGALLGTVVALHYVLLDRLMAVSGRFTALVDRLRNGPPAPVESLDMSPEELEEALLETMRAQFGSQFGSQVGSQVVSGAPPSATPSAALRRLKAPQGLLAHAVFLGALGVGGLVVALATGRFELTPTLRGAQFAATLGSGAGALLPLFAGGLLVGFGTRMCGGCTSGHGLCGVSRAQKGSLVATAVFFGTGALTALLLEQLA
ncbi:MAG: YeeE/YedE family protein [Sandaracinaceae bacterium]|nr:YeeE/YedE family protein [Sandaracinaceae bacterium]